MICLEPMFPRTKNGCFHAEPTKDKENWSLDKAAKKFKKHTIHNYLPYAIIITHRVFLLEELM